MGGETGNETVISSECNFFHIQVDDFNRACHECHSLLHHVSLQDSSRALCAGRVTSIKTGVRPLNCLGAEQQKVVVRFPSSCSRSVSANQEQGHCLSKGPDVQCSTLAHAHQPPTLVYILGRIPVSSVLGTRPLSPNLSRASLLCCTTHFDACL